MTKLSFFPVIDIFAGPGGLSEGFFSVRDSTGMRPFRIRLSIEKDSIAHQTLQLRAFFREFCYGDTSSNPGIDVPEEYYSLLARGCPPGDLLLLSQFEKEASAAREEAWCCELGKQSAEEVHDRIQEKVGAADLWVLLGGPPCQAYSLAGRSRNKGKKNYRPEADDRHYLYQEYLQVIASHSPAVFVMENVKGLLSARLNDDRDEQQVFRRILNDLQHPGNGSGTPNGSRGYEIFSLTSPEPWSSGRLKLNDFVIRCENYGIPQARHRVILFGIRSDLVKSGAAPRQLIHASRTTVKMALHGMPRVRSGVSRQEDSLAAWQETTASVLRQQWLAELERDGEPELSEAIKQTVRKLQHQRLSRGGEFLTAPMKPGPLADWYLDQRLNGCFNHSTRSHIPEDLHRYLFASCFAKTRKASPGLRDFPEPLWPKHRNLQTAGNPVGNRKREPVPFNDRFRVQVYNSPSTTITSHISKDGHYYIHPDPVQCRSLTVREAARLQTFPDNYFFAGPRTQQYHQVGNAVPPLLARQIGEIVLDVLIQAERSAGNRMKLAMV